VTDACGGISDEDMAAVFDVAWQGSPARTPVREPAAGRGAGLGLAIVKGIVEAHRVRSRSPTRTRLPVRGHVAR
jgi:signal transduction histidine kinase